MDVDTALITSGISQELNKSTANSYTKKLFQRLISIIVQPSNLSSNEGEIVIDSDTTLSEKLQKIMDKCNEAEKCSNTERSQHLAKELAVFFQLSGYNYEYAHTLFGVGFQSHALWDFHINPGIFIWVWKLSTQGTGSDVRSILIVNAPNQAPGNYTLL